MIEALRLGDEAAFRRLVDRYHPFLRRLARVYVSSPAVADEVVQDTWLAVIQGVWAFQGRSSLKTWILRILVNRAKTRGIREARTVPFAPSQPDDEVDGDEAREPGSVSAVSPETLLMSHEARILVRAAVDALPRVHRAVITMRDLEGCSSEEVCNVLGLSETNQRVILHRARSRVRNALSSYRAE